MVDLCNLLVFFYLGYFAIYWISIFMVEFGFLKGFDFDFGLYFFYYYAIYRPFFFFFGSYGWFMQFTRFFLFRFFCNIQMTCVLMKYRRRSGQRREEEQRRRGRMRMTARRESVFIFFIIIMIMIATAEPSTVVSDNIENYIRILLLNFFFCNFLNIFHIHKGIWSLLRML